jgi:hypothetical protein
MQTQQRRQTSVVLFSIALLIGSLFVAPAANAAVTPAGITIDCTDNTRTQTFTGAVGDTFTIENISGGAACTTDLTSGVVTGPVSIADRVSATFTIVRAGTFTVLASGGIKIAIMTVAISDSVVLPPDVTMTFAGCEASPLSKKGKAGAPYNLPDAIECTRTDYTLLGWAHTTFSTKLADPNTGAGATVNYVESGTMNAVWKLNNDKVQVTYDANVATKDECFSGNINVDAAGRTKTVVVSSESFTLEGSAPCTPRELRLVGWNTLGDGKGKSYAFFGSVPQGPAGGEKITLFAQWGNLCPTVGPSGGLQQGAVSPVPSSEVQWQGCDLRQADLSGANLTGANLINADLSNATLTDANLSNATLTDATLTDANLSNATLTDATLTDADLRNAILSRAILSLANLSRANLSRANLRGTNLIFANLSGANLSDATLTDANLAYATLTDADLTGANLAKAFLFGAVSGGIQGIPSALPADWTLAKGILTIPCAKGGGFQNTCKIGDIGPGGGTVFYVNETSLFNKYMEIAPRLSRQRWATSISLNGVNCEDRSIPGSRGVAIGTGQSNTRAITQACTRDQAPAAWAAREYESNGKTDWFLPSLDELSIGMRPFEIDMLIWTSTTVAEDYLGKPGIWPLAVFDRRGYPTTEKINSFGTNPRTASFWVTPVRVF